MCAAMTPPKRQPFAPMHLASPVARLKRAKEIAKLDGVSLSEVLSAMEAGRERRMKA